MAGEFFCAIGSGMTFENALNWVREAIGETASGWITKIFNGIQSYYNGGLDGLKEWAYSLFGDKIELAKEFFNQITGDFAGFFDKIKTSLIDNIGKKLVTAIIEGIATLAAGASNPAGWVLMVIKTFISVVQNCGELQAIFRNVKEAIAGARSGSPSSIRAIAERLRSLATSAIAVMLKFLLGIVGLGGILTGAKKVIDAVYNKVKSLVTRVASTIWNKLKSFLGRLGGGGLLVPRVNSDDGTVTVSVRKRNRTVMVPPNAGNDLS